MTTFGLTDTGFRPKRLDDVQADIVAQLQERFRDIDTSAESVVGQFVGIGSKVGADIWEQMDRVYKVQHPSEAYEVQLDYVVEFNGLTRLESQSSSVTVGMRGTASTLVPQETQIKSSLSTGNLFELVAGTIISNLDQIKIYAQVDDVQIDTDYTITINVIPYLIDSGATPSEETIAQALVNLINADSGAVVIASHMGDGDIMLEGKNSMAFDTTVTANLVWFSPGQYQSIDTGAILVLEDTINIIETPVGGLSEVNNFEEGVKGRGRETDAELQIRRENSLQILGAATLPAIVARMIDDVDGVVTAKGFENRTDVTDGDGRPPHSIEIVISAPDTSPQNEAIGYQLWNTKGGGAATYGNTFFDIIDGNGDTQRMFWSRPVDKYAWVIANITLYNEEIFPTDGLDQVRDQILAYGNTFTIGLDIILDRFKGWIYEVPGIDTIDIQIAITDTPGGTPIYQGTKIAIEDAWLAVFLLDRIEANLP